jgi:dihydropteroate synthase
VTEYQLPRPDRLVVVGVLNVTPDSFSDGGRYASLDAAVEHALQMRAEGADLIDVGGESTRPGAERVAADEELRRILPVIKELVAAGLPLSVDTSRAYVAETALNAGVSVVNDVSGGLADPAMAGVVAAAGAPWILMHWRGHSRDMIKLATYADVVAEVRQELCARIDAALAAGVARERIVIDPGLGFAKVAKHDWALLAHLDSLVELGFPLLVGSSRKSFLGRLLAAPGGTSRPADGREDATTALTLHAAMNGAWGVRVHQVGSSVDAARAAAAIQAAK